MDALPADKISRLWSHFGIKSILDLRSDRELDLTNRCAINSRFTPICLDPRNDPKVALKSVNSKAKTDNDKRLELQ